MKEFLQRTVAALMVAVYSLSVAPASELALTYQAGRKTLDAYLERAEVQSDREKFEKIAEQGIGAAIAEWEQNSLELKISDYDEWLLQKDALQEDLQNRKDLSFAAWTLKKQTEEKAAMQKTALYDELRSAALEFSFEKADGTTTRIVSQEFIGEAKKQWSKIADGIVQRYIDKWFSENEDAEFLRSEFLSLETSITNSLVNALLYDHASLKKLSDAEAAAVIAQQLADDIDAQTTDSMNRLFDSMQTQVEDVDENAASGGNEEEWLSRFEKELEAGLAKWDEAERSFLNARVEWEQNAENIFLNDNQKWMEAYNELEKRKSQWAEKIEKQIEEGKKKYQAKFTNLENEVNEYFEDFQYKLALELQQKQELVNAEISMYDRCREILAMAQSGVSIWYAHWGEKYKGLYSYWKTEDTFGKNTNLNFVSTQDLREEIKSWKKAYIQIAYSIIDKYYHELKAKYKPIQYPSQVPAAYKEEVEKEIQKQKEWNEEYREIEKLRKELESYNNDTSYKVITTIGKKISEQKNDIKSMCPELYKEIDTSTWECFTGNTTICKTSDKLFDWLDIFDKYTKETKASLERIYSLTGSAVDSDYDEIENEEIKLSALESYWESREKITQAVDEYAKDYSSGLESIEDTEKKLKEAEENYQNLNSEYQQKVQDLYTLQKKIAEAEKNYYAKRDEVDAALLNIETQQKKYDDLYEEWNTLKNENQFKRISVITSQINSIETSDNDFSMLLHKYYELIQKTENDNLMEKIKKIKEPFENGQAAINTNGLITDEDLESLDLEDDILEEINSNDYVAPQIFSTNEIKEIKESLEQSIEKNEFNFESEFIEKLISLDSSNANILKSQLIGNAPSEEIIKTVIEIINYCNTELENRDAIYLLLEGNLEDINNFFNDNANYEQIYKNYKDYSLALLNQKHENAKAAVLNVIKNHSRENLDEYFSALDQASEGLSNAGKATLRLYKNAIQGERDASAIDTKKLMKNLNEAYDEVEITLQEKNFHISIFENVFNAESYNELNYHATIENSTKDEDDFSVLDKAKEYSELLTKLQALYDDSKNPQSRIQQLATEMSEQETVIKKAKDDYEKKLKELHSDSEDNVLNVYIKTCNNYNDAIKESQKFYEKVEDARRNYRIAEEIYFYAENEYLRGSHYDTKTPLNIARENLEKTRTALQVIDELKKESGGSNYSNLKELNEYKESTKQYYKSRVLAYEYGQALAKQKEKLYQAQVAEQAAFENLVCEYGKKGESIEIPLKISDFITAKKTGDAKHPYSFSLNSLDEIESRSQEEKKQSNSVLTEYYTNHAIVSKDVYGTEISMTYAKKDAFDFLLEMEDKPYSLEELANAALYLKMQGNADQIKQWLESDENPESDENYPIGDIPEKMHSVNIWDIYHKGRKDSLESIYNNVIENGGEEDLVKYILFSETNMNPALELYQRQHDSLSAVSYNKVISKIKARSDVFKALAASQLAVAGVFAVIMALPFGIGLWAAAPFIAAMAIFVALQGAADKLDEVKKDTEEIQSGYTTNILRYTEKQNSNIELWRKAKKEREEEEKKFNILMYGKEEKSTNKISLKDFNIALQTLSNKENSSTTYSYIKDLHSSESSNISELFYEATKNKNLTSIEDVISEIALTVEKYQKTKTENLNNYINTKEQEKEKASNRFYLLLENGNKDTLKEKLKTEAAIAWGKNSLNKKQFNEEIISFYNNEITPNLPVHLGNKTEDYIIDSFGTTKNFYISQISDNGLNQLKTKQHYFSLLKNDLTEQYDLWLAKIKSAVKIGTEEWNSADEKINAMYNSWQKEWCKEYEKKNEEWDSNYIIFLNDKQNWINQSYLQANVQDVKIKNYTAVSKIKIATKMDDSISDYVSSLYDSDKFLRLENLTNRILSFADDECYNKNFFTLDKIDSSLLKNYDEVLVRQTEIESDMKKAAAKYKAEEFQLKMEEDIKNYFAKIQAQNEGIEDWELDMVLKSGYRVDSEIHRNAIVDSTAFQTIREEQTVHRYQFFRPQAPNVSIEKIDYKGDNDHFVMCKIEEIQFEIQKWQEKIFGKTDKDGNEKTKGEFKKHIGESPKFKETPDLTKSREDNIENPGSGEMGMIMLDFQWNSMKNKMGYDELSKAVYDQKLIADSDGFHLPTIREIVGTICDILGNCGMVWFKYLDDTIFGILDLSMGYKSLEEVVNDGIKQGLLSAVSYGASAAGSAVFSSVGSKLGTAAGSQILAAAQNATVGLVNNVASSYINAIDFINGTMDWEQANSVWSNASTFTSIAGTMLGGALGEWNNVDGNGQRLHNIFGGDISKMNNTIGNLSTAAMNYAFTGDISFNLASINGVGLFEVGIKDGEFSAGISQGGTNFSLFSSNLQQVSGNNDKTHLKFSMNDNIFQTFVNGIKDAKQVADLKNGSLEDKSVKLNAANLLAWSGTKNNFELAQKLFNGEQKVIFAELDGDKMLSAREDDTIVLNSQFLSNDKDKQAMITSLIAYQNAVVSDNSFSVNDIDLSIIKKNDGTDYTAEEIENMKNKFGSDHTIGALIDSSAAFATAHDLLNSDYKSIENTEELAAFAKVYKERGVAGIFSVYAAAYEAEKARIDRDYGGGSDDENISSETNRIQTTKLTFENVMKLGWYQNRDKNGNIENYDELLGFSMTKEDYNNLAKKNAAERYANERLSELNLSEDSIELTKKILITDALKDEELLKQYGYKEQTKETSLALYGCTLSTVAYIAYSITGKVMSLKEANEVLKKNNVFVGVTDKNGIYEKNLLNAADGTYLKAVNTLAGFEALEMDGKNFQETTSSNIFNRIITNRYDKDNVYYTHLRIDNGAYIHSVLLDSVSYIDKNNPTLSKINIYNPWSGGWAGRTEIRIDEIRRADFYKLTEAGKNIYNLRRAFTEAITSKNEKYVNLQKSL